MSLEDIQIILVEEYKGLFRTKAGAVESRRSCGFQQVIDGPMTQGTYRRKCTWNGMCLHDAGCNSWATRSMITLNIALCYSPMLKS